MIHSSVQNELVELYYVMREISLLFQSSRNGKGCEGEEEGVVGV